MNAERTSRTANSRLLRLVEVLPGPGSVSQPSLHLDGDEDISDGSDQIDLVVPDSNIAIENAGASVLEESSGDGLAGHSDGEVFR